MKKIIIISVAAVIIVTVALLCFFLIPGDDKITVEEADKIINNEISQALSSTVDLPNDLKLITDNSSIAVDSVEYIDENKATAYCTVTALNVYDPLVQMTKDLADSEMTYAQMLEKTKEYINTAQTTDTNIEVTLNKVDGKWLPELDSEDCNAYLGGYIDYCSYVLSNLLED